MGRLDYILNSKLRSLRGCGRCSRVGLVRAVQELLSYQARAPTFEVELQWGEDDRGVRGCGWWGGID